MRFLICLLFFICSFGFSDGKRTNIAFITIWKSGANLIKKCVFKLMEEHYEEFSFYNDSLDYDYSGNWKNNGDRNGYHYYFSHFDSLQALDEFIEKSPHMKFIFNIRDPRDVYLSACGYIDKYSYDSNFLNRLNMDYQTWLTKTMEEKLTLSINQLKHNEQYQNLLLLQKKYPNILLVQFEDLVGEKGGGSDLFQLIEVRKISKYLGLNLSSYEIKNIADQLFGGTKTFQKGQIGSYKDFFNKSHYEDFYRVFNGQMEDLSLYYDFFESLIYRPHIQLSVMKSGTGLTERLLELLCDGEKKPYNIVDFLQIKNINLSEDWYRNFSIPKKVRLGNHFFKSDAEFINQILLNNKSILALVNIRDPRDTCVSLVHFFNSIKEENRANYSKLVPKNWDDLSEDEKLSFAISRESTLAEQFENALNTNKLENTLLIKFENLVGQRGGGSDSLQLEEIQKVVDGLQMHYITDDKLHQIANSLFGAGWTFRKGEIGGYKEAFKDHHYVEFFEAFKDVIESLSKYYDFSI